MLVDGIAVTAHTYEETKGILLDRYGEPNRIIQARLDYLEGLPPATSATPDEMNNTFIECHRRVQALRALGEDVDWLWEIVGTQAFTGLPPRRLPAVGCPC